MHFLLISDVVKLFNMQNKKGWLTQFKMKEL